MKCQKCDKPATFHITELTDGNPQELHLCEDHARQYLSQSGIGQAEPENVAAALAQQMAQHMAAGQVGQTAEELARLDQQLCPVCGISFYDFRSQGRLGCPNDYICFEQQLNPLILNIHGETEHTGKAPKVSAQASQERTQVIRFRREMQEAIAEEDYERASKLRDTIRRVEQEDENKPAQ
ncbi:MAG TPA: UvrB/UvrC motif-containing protein [Thermoguttaceae bacterium]|nr:UvrB/UvrC motif-containing protein [Thermoguttaceae bacterium]